MRIPLDLYFTQAAHINLLDRLIAFLSIFSEGITVTANSKLSQDLLIKEHEDWAQMSAGLEGTLGIEVLEEEFENLYLYGEATVASLQDAIIVPSYVMVTQTPFVSY